MQKTDETQQKLSCAAQLLQLREFYMDVAETICKEVMLTPRTLNRRIANDSFSVAEAEMINKIITSKKTELCA